MADISLRIVVDSSGAVKSVNDVASSLNKFTREADHADNKLRQFEKGIGSFRRAILGVQSALLGFGISDLVRDLVRVNAEFEKVRYSLRAAHDSMAAANADFAWIRQEAIKLGMPLNKVGIEFAKLGAAAKGTALQGQPTRDVFKSVGKASIAMGLDVASTSRIFMALTQMLSKGKVQAEEARQQFGEHLPGGFRALAVAAGFDAVTGLGKFQDALKKGQVDAIAMMTNLPKVLDEMFGPAFEAALVASPQVAINQFKALMANIAYEVGQTGGFMREFVGMLRDMSDEFNTDEGRRQIEKLGTALGWLMSVVRQAVRFIVSNIHEVVSALAGLTSGAIIIGLRGLAGWMVKLAGSTTLLGAMANPWILLAAAIGAAVTALMMFSDNVVTIGGKSARVVDWLGAAFDLVGTKIGLVGQGLNAVFPQLTASLGTFGAAVGAAFGNTLVSLFSNLITAARSIITAFKPLGDAFKKMFNGADLEGIVGTALVAVVNLVLGAINLIGASVRFISEIFRITFQAIMPIVEPVVDAILGIVDMLVETIKTLFNLQPNTNGWDLLAGAISFVWEALGYATAAVVGAISFIASVAGPILDAVMLVVRGVFDVIMSVVATVVGLFTGAHKTMTETAGESTSKSANFWIKAGDIIVGVLLTVIRIVGVAIRAIASFAGAIIEVAGRVGELLGSIGLGLVHAFTGNMDGLRRVGEEIKDAVTRPLRTDFAALKDDVGRQAGLIRSGADFNTVSNAVSSATQTKAAFDTFGRSAVQGFGQIGPEAFRTGQPRLNAAASAAGSSGGKEFADSFMRSWADRASARSADDAAKKAAFKAAQDEKASLEAQAWAAENAGIDRTIRPDLVGAGAGSSGGRGRRSVSEKAQDLIDDLRAAQDTDNMLSIQIGIEPYLDQKAIKGIEAAQDALRKAGYEFSYAEAQSQGGMPKMLSDVAYSASLASQQLEIYKKMQTDITKNMREIDGLREQVDLARDLTMSSNDLADSLAAQQALKATNSDLTVREALAMTELGEALYPVEYALVKTAMAQSAWNREAKAAGEIAKELRSFDQVRTDMLALAVANDKGAAAFIQTKAELAAQRAVMEKYGDEVWNSSRLLDANTRALYDNAMAMALLGGNAEAATSILRGLNDQYLELTNPTEAARVRITDDAASKQAMLNALQVQAENRFKDDFGAAAGLGDPALVQSGIDAAIQRYQEAKSAIDNALMQLRAVTEADLQKNSDSFTDAAMTSLRAFAKDAQFVGTKLQDIFSKAFDGAADALTEFVMTGKLDFASLARSIIADITRMIIKWMMWMAIKAAASAFGIPLPFADGGVMSSAGPVNTYAKGGIARSPQLAVFGEGSMAEAYVPLPDGRTIPVTMSSSGGGFGGGEASDVGYAIADALMSAYRPASGPSGGYTQPTGSTGGGGPVEVNAPITITIEAGAAGAGQGQQGGGAGVANDQRMMELLSKKLGAELRSTVVSVVQDEMRPGGAFNRMGSNRSRF